MSAVPQNPFDPNRFLTADTAVADKQVHFDEDQPGPANPVALSILQCSTTTSENAPNLIVNPPRRNRWPEYLSHWRGAVSLMLALVGVIALLSSFTSYRGASYLSHSLGQYTPISSATRPLHFAFPLPFRTTPDLCTSVVDTFLARALPIGQHDFTLLAHGGKIFHPLTTPSVPLGSDISLPIDSILSNDVQLDGCWQFAGSQFQVGISFATTIHPTHITIDYTFLPSAISLINAPRHMIVWGVVEGVSNKGRASRVSTDLVLGDFLNHTAPSLHQRENFLPLATVEYNIHGSSHMQTFSVNPSVVESNIDFSVVVLEVLDNWGGDITRLYRVRIHGFAKT